MRDMYKYLDTKYIKPCLLRDNQYRDPKIIETFENLTNKVTDDHTLNFPPNAIQIKSTQISFPQDAVEFMKRNPTQFAGLKTGGNGEHVPPGMASVMGPGKSHCSRYKDVIIISFDLLARVDWSIKMMFNLSVRFNY